MSFRERPDSQPKKEDTQTGRSFPPPTSFESKAKEGMHFKSSCSNSSEQQQHFIGNGKKNDNLRRKKIQTNLVFSEVQSFFSLY